MKPPSPDAHAKPLPSFSDGQSGHIEAVLAPPDQGVDQQLIKRLNELGFLPGERVTVLRRGPGGREPIAVQVGDSLFALRHVEAACIAALPELNETNT